jgi:uncharacterized membrane protein SpoIIM required for sporulation
LSDGALKRFEYERGPAWADLDARVARARGRTERLGPDGVRALGALYRQAAGDLAFARRAFPGDPVVDRLERSVGAGRAAVYQGSARRISVWRFLHRGYWEVVREDPWALGLAWVLLLCPAVLAWIWAGTDPAGALGVVPAMLQGAADPPVAGRGLVGGTAAAFSSHVFVNNVQVSFVAFGAGVIAGLGSAVVLLFNGLELGAVGGLAAGAGNLRSFVGLVTPHGVLELSCTVVAGAAGLRLGRPLVDPGSRRRSEALVTEARRSVLMVLGTVPWLGVCGLVEGFADPGALGLGGVLGLGFGLGAVYWSLVLWRGRPVTGERHAWP